MPPVRVNVNAPVSDAPGGSLAFGSVAASVTTGGIVSAMYTVAVPGGFDLPAYGEQLIHRFDNPALAHRTAQIAMDGTQKVAVRWLPALRERLARGQASPLLERLLALWLHALQRDRADDGRALALAAGDPGAPALATVLRGAGGASAAVQAALAFAPVFGHDPWPEALGDRLATHLDTLDQGGTPALFA